MSLQVTRVGRACRGLRVNLAIPNVWSLGGFGTGMPELHRIITWRGTPQGQTCRMTVMGHTGERRPQSGWKVHPTTVILDGARALQNHCVWSLGLQPTTSTTPAAGGCVTPRAGRRHGVPTRATHAVAWRGGGGPLLAAAPCGLCAAPAAAAWPRRRGSAPPDPVEAAAARARSPHAARRPLPRPPARRFLRRRPRRQAPGQRAVAPVCRRLR